MNPLTQKIQEKINQLQTFVDHSVWPKSKEQQACEQEIRETIVFLKDLMIQLVIILPKK
jgi:hypothetical protein